MEIWKPIVGFDNYAVSSLGRIRSVIQRKGSRANINGGIISGWIQTIRYCYQRRLVALRKNGKTHIRKVHRLVLEAFCCECPHGMESLHKNGDSLDNKYSNLRWGTHKDNVADAIAHGTKKKPPVHKGENHPKATISNVEVKALRLIPYRHGLFADLARKHRVSVNTISRIWNGVSR